MHRVIELHRAFPAPATMKVFCTRTRVQKWFRMRGVQITLCNPMTLCSLRGVDCSFLFGGCGGMKTATNPSAVRCSGIGAGVAGDGGSEPYFAITAVSENSGVICAAIVPEPPQSARIFENPANKPRRGQPGRRFEFIQDNGVE